MILFKGKVKVPVIINAIRICLEIKFSAIFVKSQIRSINSFVINRFGSGLDMDLFST